MSKVIVRFEEPRRGGRVPGTTVTVRVDDGPDLEERAYEKYKQYRQRWGGRVLPLTAMGVVSWEQGSLSKSG